MAKRTVESREHRSGLSFNSFIGWGVSTLLLWLLNRHNSSGDTSSMQASPYTDSNSNQIGQPIPVVLGRAMIKNPLISYYGAYEARIYTEEYGAHSNLNIWPAVLLMLIPVIIAASQKDTIEYTAGVGKEVSDNGMVEAVSQAGSAMPTATSAGGSGGGMDGDLSPKPTGKTPKSKTPPAVNQLRVVPDGKLIAGPYTVGGEAPVVGTVEFAGAGKKRAAIANALLNFILWLLMYLIGSHLLRTTIQKGFKYYLGWQHILCWTDENIGIKKIWMNVYDSDVEQSTQKGVWDNNDHIAYKQDNLTGITADINDDQMFGGWDEGGGFVGQVRIYFGNDGKPYPSEYKKWEDGVVYGQNDIMILYGHSYSWVNPRTVAVGEQVPTQSDIATLIANGDLVDNGEVGQPKDPWMINEMKASTIPTQLQGLTPKYPMFLTCVISDSDLEHGAYIGKQASIPEMWFEVVNYTNKLYKTYQEDLFGMYSGRIGELVQDILDYINNQDPSVQTYMKDYTKDLTEAKAEYDAYYKAEKLKLDELDRARDDLERAEKAGDAAATQNAQDVYDKAEEEAQEAHEKTEETFQALRDASDAIVSNYPQTNRDEVASLVTPLDELLDHGVWTLGKLGDDLNPAEAIFAILTNNMWGCDYDNLSDIDMDSLLHLGITCEEEGLGISCLITSEAQAGQYIRKILTHINGIVYDNPYTGKITFKLIRGDYDVNSLIVFNPSNCAEMQFTRLDWSETSSATAVKYTFASEKYDENTFTYQDVANRFITKSYKESTVDGLYFTTSTNANWLAQVSQLASGYPLSTVQFTTNRLGHDIGLGDPIKIHWLPYGIDNQVYRVTDIDYATLTSNAIKITAIEDIYGFANTRYAYAEVPEWTDPKKYATSIQYFMYMEVPFELTRSLDTFVRAYAARPSIDDEYYVNYRYSGIEYAKVTQTNTWSMVAQLVYGTRELYDEDNTGFEIEVIGSDARQMFDDKCDAIVNYPSVYTNKSAKNMMCIEGEILTYDTMIKLPNGHYTLTNVIHGVYDTLPKDHPAYSKVFFLDNYLPAYNLSVATEGNTADEQYELRAGTVDEEEAFTIPDIVNFYTVRRSESPSPMANLMFGAEKGDETIYNYNYPSGTIFAHDVVFKYNLRNKFNQSSFIEVQSDVNDAEPEDTTQYYIKFSCNGINDEFRYDAVVDVDDGQGNITKEYPTDITLFWNEFCEKMGDRLQRVSDVQLEIGTYNKQKELYSFDHYDKHIIWHVPRVVGIIYPQPGDDVEQLVKDYADSIVTATHIEIPQSAYIESTTITFEDASLVLVADSTTTSLDGITGQDGVRYIPSTKAYRVDGANGDNDAILHEIELKEEYVLQNDFTRADGVNRRYYRYRNNNWYEIQLYGNT